MFIYSYTFRFSLIYNKDTSKANNSIIENQLLINSSR